MQLKRKELRTMPMSGTQSASGARVLADRRMSTDSRSLLEGMDQQREQVLEDASSKGLVLYSYYPHHRAPLGTDMYS